MQLLAQQCCRLSGNVSTPHTGLVKLVPFDTTLTQRIPCVGALGPSQASTSWAVTERMAGSQKERVSACLRAETLLFQRKNMWSRDATGRVGREEGLFFLLVRIWGPCCGAWASRDCLRPCVKSLWKCPDRFHHLDKKIREKAMKLRSFLERLRADTSSPFKLQNLLSESGTCRQVRQGRHVRQYTNDKYRHFYPLIWTVNAIFIACSHILLNS